MALPKLEVPKYTLTLPSSGDVIEYRPFLVKEEKNLMIAQETGGEDAMFNAMIDIIKACTFEQVNTDKLLTYDMEYIFLQIRAKSVGETAEVGLKCEECGEVNQVEINLTDAYVDNIDNAETEKTIKINDEVGITLQHVSLDMARRFDGNAKDLTKTIKLLLKSIYDADGVYLASESSDAELTTFIESLPHNTLEEVSNFIQSTPQLVIDVKFKCKKCGHDNVIKLQGIANFFE